ncbi:MAG: AMP-binding protein, partial [Cyanobacteria bacterium P01_D01_bin.115]
MLGKGEQKQLRQWNQTEAGYPHHLCLHELFEQQVEKAPDATALIFAEQSLTYQELNARANQLACHLQAHGIGSEALVGICMERTTDMVVALLAILKAGAAYVPLDPAYPAERLRFILQDAQVALLITDGAAVLGEARREDESMIAKTKSVTHPTIPILNLAEMAEAIAPRFHSPTPPLPHSPAALAYVIYTSGSTGRPKGVAIE